MEIEDGNNDIGWTDDYKDAKMIAYYSGVLNRVIVG